VEKPFILEDLIDSMRKALQKVDAEGPEEQNLIHKEEVVQVLERAAMDGDFVSRRLFDGTDAFQKYNLANAEKLAILTGELHWIENQMGALSPKQKRWLEQRSMAEIW
jgi:hypothetical protein